MFPDREIYPVIFVRIIQSLSCNSPCAVNFVSRKFCRYILHLIYTPYNYAGKYLYTHCTDNRVRNSLKIFQQPKFITFTAVRERNLTLYYSFFVLFTSLKPCRMTRTIVQNHVEVSYVKLAHYLLLLVFIVYRNVYCNPASEDTARAVPKYLLSF